MKNNKFYLIQIIVFIVIISLPLLGQAFSLDKQIVTNENRTLAKKPTLSLAKLDYFPGAYVNYFNDNFGFRNYLLELNSLIKVKYLKTPPVGSGVTIGKDGRYFYTSDDTLIDTLNSHPFSDSELYQIQKNLEQMQSYFASKGAKFYFMVAPNSQSIYPELLPSYITKFNPNSRLDQIADYLKAHNAQVNFINPKPDLISNKNSQLYYKYDTHWNQYGAFIAYSDLMASMSKDFPNIKANRLSDFQISYLPSSRDDLAINTGTEEYVHELEPIFTPINPNQAKQMNKPCENIYSTCPEVVEATNNPSLPTMVAYRDSFLIAVIPFLSEHFKTADYFWGGLPLRTDVINKQKPDIVLYELTERELWRLPYPIFDFQN